MALKSCKECGSSVSTLANTCPKCGAPDPTEGILVLKQKTSKRSSKKVTEEKEEGSKGSMVGVILILVMFGLLSIPLFNWGKFGFKKTIQVYGTVEQNPFKSKTDESSKPITSAGLPIIECSMNSTSETLILDLNWYKDNEMERVASGGWSEADGSVVRLNISDEEYRLANGAIKNGIETSHTITIDRRTGGVEIVEMTFDFNGTAQEFLDAYDDGAKYTGVCKDRTNKNL
tara:strand:+ start:120 stop:812 length:693 start_codon:yes stop_codon:yes gene_type:complete